MASFSLRSAYVPTEARETGSVEETLLVLSDVHLGSDLNDFAPEGSLVRRSSEIDRDLARLVRHYAGQKPPHGARFRLVIAGDFIDFIGISLRATEASPSPATPLNAEEEEHGLGNAEDHAVTKLQRVIARHEDVFDALATFICCGHALTLVHGNHDVELHWGAVQRMFVDDLTTRTARVGESWTRERVDALVTFHPWFFYVDGLVYVEHGHQYDAFCATEHVMSPLSPLDPRRVARGFCDVLLRYVVRPTQGLREHGHETMGVFDYVSFGAKLGLRGMWQLTTRFVRAILELFKLRREHLTEAAKTLRAEHEKRLAMLSEARRISMEKLRAVIALQSPPITKSVMGILGSLLLDQIALGMLTVLALLGAATFFAFKSAATLKMHGWYVAALIAIAWFVFHRVLARMRQIDPQERLAERASQLAHLFPAAFVVMGHTHVPRTAHVAESTTYINVGSWAEEEAESPDHVYRAARTHLVIHYGDNGQPIAQLLAWDSAKAAPKDFVFETKK